LRAQVEQLSLLVEQIRREGKRQAAPFRKKDLKGDPKRPGRKKGGGDGSHSFRKPPSRAPDRVVRVDLPECCPGCGRGDVGVERTVSQLVEDLPAVAVLLTRFDIQIGRRAIPNSSPRAPTPPD
jgi:transposase